MAALSSIPAREFIKQCPQALRDWIEQDLMWNLEDIKDIMIERETFEVEPECGYRKFNHGPLIDVSITGIIEGEYEIRKHQFLQTNGGWAKFPQNGWAECEAPVSKEEMKELNDNDVFDLMDSIRDELWK